MDINININAGETPRVKIKKDKEPKIKKRVRKIKNGKETVLELPNAVAGDSQRSPILDMMGL